MNTRTTLRGLCAFGAGVLALAASLAGCRSTPTIRLDASTVKNLPPPEFVWFGIQLVRYADLDGDGTAEFALGCGYARWSSKRAEDRAGAVVILSGRTLATLRVVSGRRDENFGTSACVLEADLDGDGKPELAACAPGEERGHVVIVGSHSGARLREIAADEVEPGSAIGSAVTGLASRHGTARLVVRSVRLDGHRVLERWHVVDPLVGVFQHGAELDVPSEDVKWNLPRRASNVGDVDADGTDDFVVPLDRELRVFSGADAKQLQAVRMPGYWETPCEFGDVACALGDRDGDGCGDFAALNAHGDRIVIVSGRRGRVLDEWSVCGGPQSIVRVHDIDSDGVRDIAVGLPSFGPDCVALLSGRDGGGLGLLGSQSDISGFGRALAFVPDFDASGRPALAVTRFTDEAIGDLGQGLELVEFGARGLDGVKLVATRLLDDYVKR